MKMSKVAILLTIVSGASALRSIVELHNSTNKTMDEYKDEKAADQQAEEDAAAKEAKMAAVNKVVHLLEDLTSQVLAEGEAEAHTYNKFACFCKDTMTDKSTAITEGTDARNTLRTAIKALEVRRVELDGIMSDRTTDIKHDEGNMTKSKKERAETLAIYEKDEADMSGALDALEGAIKVLKSSKSPSLAQLQSVQATVETAALMADALGFARESTKRTIAFFLQSSDDPDSGRPEVQTENYKFKSGDIIETLEGLLDDFREDKATLDREEVNSTAVHNSYMQKKTSHKKQMEKELSDAKEEKAQKQADIAENSEELSTTAATLLADKSYLTELDKMCQDRAQMWDQRSRVRADEITALVTATGIVKGAVADSTSAKAARFAQQGVTVRLASTFVRDENSMEAIEADTESQFPESFLQKALLSKSRRPDTDGRQVVIDMLKAQGNKMHSALLVSLAGKIQGDPLAKVKTLIQELIDRLLTEAGNEANQKGWCDKAMSDAEQRRDYAAEEIASLNGNMAKLEARRDKLNQELVVLADEIGKLYDNRNTTVAERAAEKAENNATVMEAEFGLEAVESAIDILDKFYKTAAKTEDNFTFAQTHKGPADDAPDAGFGGDEVYKGAGAESGGVLGMLDVIKSDFVRTIKETKKAEEEARQDHVDFLTETGKSLAEKTEAEKAKTSQRDDADTEISADDGKLDSQTTLLQTAIKELIELKATCIDTGMSYAERVARREDEIDSLKKALCILQAYEQYGPDGLSDAC